MYKLEDIVEIIPHLSFEDWLVKVNTFDIFLYQIPLDSYSSIDGTMQAAMLLCKPVVYYGSESPKELIVHGESGFIANNKEEFVHYASLLANNVELRMRMGQKAKERILTKFNWHDTVEEYNKLYLQFTSNKPVIGKLSIRFIIDYQTAKFIFILRNNFVNLFPRDVRKNFKRTILDFLRK